MNYLHGSVPGTASVGNALVIDGNKDITGIHNLNADNISATTLTGTIGTAAQPNITSLGSLVGLTIASGNNLTIGTARLSSTDICRINNITSGTAAALKALVLDSNKNISGISNLSATTGTFTNITGTIGTAAQPNITSLGTLTGLNTSGNIIINGFTVSPDLLNPLNGSVPGTASATKALITDSNNSISGLNNLSVTGTVTIGSTTLSESDFGNVNGITPGTASASKAIILDSNKDIVGINNLSATTLDGTLTTSAQPNITSLGTLTGLSSSGVINISDTSSSSSATTGALTVAGGVGIGGNLFVGGNLDINGSIISQEEIIKLDNTIPGTATPDKSMVTDTNNSIGGINNLSATTLGGTLTTPAQPNITSLGTITGLSSSGAINISDTSSSSSATTGALTVAGGVGIGGDLFVGGNLDINGSIISQDEIIKLDNTIPGTATPNKAMVTDANNSIDSINNLSATTLGGTLSTPAQPNITSLGTLTGLLSSGIINISDTTNSTSISTGSIISAGGLGIAKDMYLGGILNIKNNDNSTSISSGSLIIAGGAGITKDMYLGGVLNIKNSDNSTSTSSGSLIISGGAGIAKDIYTGGLINIGNVVNSTSTSSGSLIIAGGMGIAKDMYIGGSINIVNTDNSTSTSSGSLVISGGAGIAKDIYIGGAINGTIATAAQPNITSLGTLDSLNVNNDIVISSGNSLIIGSTSLLEHDIENINDITPGSATASKALVLDSNKDITGIDNLSATTLSGTLSTTNQPNITSVNTLNISQHDGNSMGLKLGNVLVTATSNQINYLTVTPGTATASHALVLDTSKNINSINNLSANTLSGTLSTASQPNITSLGTLIGLNIASNNNLTIGSTFINETDISRIASITPGSATASKALVLDSTSNISNINSLSLSLLRIGNTTNSDLPAEIGYVSYSYSSAYAYHNSDNSLGIESSSNATGNYSLRCNGRVIVTGEIEIASDYRLKKNISILDESLAKSFVMNTTPVSFNWNNEDSKIEYGYIAQSVLKSGFKDLVNVTPHPGLQEYTENDGFVNPKDAKFTLSSGKIIPLLALNQKIVFEELKSKDNEIQLLKERISRLEDMLAKICY